MERFELARLLGVTPHVGEPSSRPAVIEEADPGAFMSAFATAVAEGGPIFLADQAWSLGEREQLATLLARPATSAS